MVCEEERLRLLDNTLSVPHRFISNHIEHLHKSITSKMGFHCHNSASKDRQNSSKKAKRNLLAAFFLVVLFLCIEVKIHDLLYSRYHV